MVSKFLLLGVALAAASPATTPRVYVTDARVYHGKTGNGRWRPSDTDVIAALAALRRYLNDPATPVRNAWERTKNEDVRLHFDSYVLQVQGVRRPTDNQFFDTEGTGAKQIHIDGFCPSIAKEAGESIKHEQLVVMDGGSCTFQAIYDMESKRIALFMVNGVA